MTRILVIDDDVTLAELMRVVLEDADFIVAVGRNARDLPSGRYDCIVTDLVTIGAYTLQEARDWLLRLADLYPGVPVIVATGHVEARRDKAAIGARDVIVKPFDVDELVAKVRAVTS
ncbi:MAG TPA: response regulator [Candidatus Limnocylindrales bacterium]|nr:response regulator [Candidatus Limnocylindrales bacterium]